jgi:hypothetical protein
MKTNKFPSVAQFFVLGFLLLGGCLDINTTTEIKDDGTIVRTITFTGDSAEVYAGKFPVELDSLWTKTTVNAGDKKVTLTATRTFLNADELNKAVAGRFGATLQYRVSLEKSFQWFFTVYRYEETNLPFAQFTAIPIKDYLSQEEIDWFKTKVLAGDLKEGKKSVEDSLIVERISPRAEEWTTRNRFEPFYLTFLSGVAAINDPSLTTSAVESLKDSLYRHSARAVEKGNFDTLRTIFRHLLKNPAAERAWRASAPAFEEIKRKLEFEQSIGTHNYVTSVVMPGLITGSNARTIEDNKATWKDFLGTVSYFEYTMWVESRRVNWWAVIVAGGVVISLVIGLVFSVLRRRSR